MVRCGGIFFNRFCIFPHQTNVRAFLKVWGLGSEIKTTSLYYSMIGVRIAILNLWIREPGPWYVNGYGYGYVYLYLAITIIVSFRFQKDFVHKIMPKNLILLKKRVIFYHDYVLTNLCQIFKKYCHNVLRVSRFFWKKVF